MTVEIAFLNPDLSLPVIPVSFGLFSFRHCDRLMSLLAPMSDLSVSMPFTV